MCTSRTGFVIELFSLVPPRRPRSVAPSFRVDSRLLFYRGTNRQETNRCGLNRGGLNRGGLNRGSLNRGNELANCVR